MAEIPSDNDAFNQALPAGGVDQALEAATTPMSAPAALSMDAQPTLTAPQTPQGPVNVLNPRGELVSIPHEQLQDALESGYKQADDSHVEHYLKEQKYGTTEQMIKTGLEGAAEAATFGLSTAVEKALGVKGEDIEGRRETNPMTHMGSQALGLAASALIPGVGEANLLADAGKGAAAAIGLGGEGIISKIGSAAVKNAVETGLFQSGDEVSKMLTQPPGQDPTTMAETALTNIGLASLLGGGIGAGAASISPLWKATVGAKLGGVLKAIQNRGGGVEGAAADAINDAIQTSGMNVSPEIKAGITGDSHIQNMFQTLQESASGSGLKAQDALKSFKNQAGDAMASALGKTPEEVTALTGVDEYEAGQQIKTSLKNQLKAQIDPISENFTKIRNKYKDIELPKDAEPTLGAPAQPGIASQISDKLVNAAQEYGWNLSAETPEAKLMGRIQRELPNLKTLEDLRKYQSLVGEEAQRQQLWKFGTEARKIFRQAEDGIVDRAMAGSADGANLIKEHSLARSAYKGAMDTIDGLNDRLHVGRFNGPDSFMKALDEMKPEDVLRRLSPKGDAGVITQLGEKFPETLNQIKQFHTDQVLKHAADKAMPGQSLNPQALKTQLDKMSPQMRGFIMSPEAQAKIDAVSHLLEGLPSKMNTSGTGKTLDALMSHFPGSALGLAGMLAGHNPAVSVLLGGLTKIMARDVPDAARLALLKFVGSSAPLESEGFKAMTDFIHHAIKGENMTSKAVTGLFKAGADVLPQALLPSQKDRDKLDKHLKTLQEDPRGLETVGGKTAHYLPEQGQAVAQMSANVTSYLDSVRPNTSPKGMLDGKVVVSSVEKAKYNNALDIAQQPLTVLAKIKEGNVTASDITAMKTMYPALYSRISQKIMTEVVNTTSKGNAIPYKTRIGLSMFVGQPLDSTMSQSSILAAQPVQGAAPQPGQASTPKHSTSPLSKLPKQYMTASQSAAADRASRQ